MRYVFLFLLVFPFSNLKAQKTFHAGLLGGFNGSQIHGDSYSGFNKFGLVGGAFICTDPTQPTYFQMELLFSQKGSKKIANPAKGDYDIFELRMNYVEAPFLCRVKLHKMYFEFGETIGILTQVREWDDFGEVTPQDFRKWETALVLGLGMNLREHWGVDFRYTNSVFPVKKFATPLYYQNFFSNLFNKGMYNNVLGLSVFYRFGKDNPNE